MTKVSAPTFVVCGLGDPKVSLAKARVADGLQANIPVLGCYRLTWGGTTMDNMCAAVNVASKHRSSPDRQIRSGVYLMCDGALILRKRCYMRFHCPGKASQGDNNQIVPITDTGGLVE